MDDQTTAATAEKIEPSLTATVESAIVESATVEPTAAKAKSVTGRPITDLEDVEVRYDMPWLTSVLRPGLIAVMTACLTIGLLAFLRYVAPTLPFLYTGITVALTIIATLLGCISTTWLAQPGQRGKRNTGLRLAELGLLLGITRLAVWITVGNWPTFDLFFTKPLEAMLDGAFIMALIVVGLAWSLASAITGDFIKMSLQPDELYAAQQRTGRSGDDPTPPNYTDRRGVLGGFVTKWMSGGVLMVLLSAGTQLESSQNGFFAIGRQNIDPVVITATVLYFLTGLVLISQGQFAVLRARWTLEKVPSSGSVLRNWPIYGAMMIGGVGLLATLLPFGGTFYFARILRTIIWSVGVATATVMQILLGLFGAFLSLFIGEPPEEPEAAPALDIQPFQMPEAVEEAAGAPPWLGGTIFWILLTLLLGYAAYIYLGGRGFSLAWLRRFWSLLTMRLRELFGAYGDWQGNRRRSTDDVVAEEGGAATVADNWLNRLRLRNLSPDQQVRYFYMTMLNQAKEAGIGRGAGETPLQYAPRLLDFFHPPRASADDESAPGGSAPGGTAPYGTDASVDELATAGELADHASARVAEEEQSTAEEQSAVEEQSAALERSSERVRSLTDAFLRVRYAGTTTDAEELPQLKAMWDAVKKQIKNIG